MELNLPFIASKIIVNNKEVMYVYDVRSAVEVTYVDFFKDLPGL